MRPAYFGNFASARVDCFGRLRRWRGPSTLDSSPPTRNRPSCARLVHTRRVWDCGETVPNLRADRSFSPLSPMYVHASPQPFRHPGPCACARSRTGIEIFDPRSSITAGPDHRSDRSPTAGAYFTNASPWRYHPIRHTRASPSDPSLPRIRSYDARSGESRSRSSTPKSPTGKCPRVESSSLDPVRQMPWPRDSFL